MLNQVRARAVGLLKTARAELQKGNENGAGRIYKQVARIYYDGYKETKATGKPDKGLLDEAQRWNIESKSLLGTLRQPLEERLDEVPAFTPEPIKETIDLTAVKGLHETKERILNTVAMRILNLLEKPDGILFYGPPGTGKTLLARALAGECTKALENSGYKVYFFNVDRSEVQSHLFGVTEKNLKNVFETAKKYASVEKSISLVFFDELHGLISSTGSEKSELGERVAATFYTLLDGLSGRGNILPIGATNYPTKLPAPLLRSGRYGVSILVPPPDLEALTAMFGSYTKEFPAFTFKINPEKLGAKAKAKSFTGADVKGVFEKTAVRKTQELCNYEGERSLAEVIEELKIKQNILKTKPITDADFEAVIAGTKSSLPLWYSEIEKDLEKAPEAYRAYFSELETLVKQNNERTAAARNV